MRKNRGIFFTLLTASVFTILIMIFTVIAVNAEKYGGFGDVYYLTNETLAPGLEYKTFHAENERGFVFEYTARLGTVPVASCGTYVYGRETLADIIDDMNNKNDINICAGINADFFSMQTGIPLGVMIGGGRLYANCEKRDALGFYPDGSAIIGTPNIDIKLTVNDLTDNVEYFNKYPSEYGTYILNEDFSETTKSRLPSLEITVKLEENAVFTQWCDIKGVVTGISRDSKDNKIESGCCVISVANDTKFYKIYKDVKIGDKAEISIRCSEEWKNVVTAVGGGDIILEDYTMPDGIVDEEHETLKNPRTAVGLTEDGRVIFFAVDGRRNGYSAGLTLAELASSMWALGCKKAINLDGGGSTTVLIKNYATGKYELKNRPTDGEQRKISSAILFVNTLQGGSAPTRLSIIPNSPYVLSNGGKVELNINALDDAYNILDIDLSRYDFVYSLSENIGVIENNVFTACVDSGRAVLTAEMNINGITARGKTDITVIPTLTDFDVVPRHEQATFGGSVKLDFYAYRMSYGVYAAPARFNVSCENGYVDENGVFYHDGESLSETAVIIINYGMKTQCVNIVVTDIPHPFADIDGHWAETEIVRIFGMNLTNGEISGSERLFNPERNITRSEFAKMLAVYSGLEIDFSETKTPWDVPYIDAVIKAGLMKGKLAPDGTVDFKGSDYITRAEIMYVFSQMIKADNNTAPVELKFSDIGDIPVWAAENINYAVAAGIVKGYADNTIQPLKNVTRAETAVMFVRLKNYRKNVM